MQANWTIRGVKYRYIKYQKSGDHFVGRTVYGLPIPRNEFYTSPQYFDFSDFEDDKKGHGKGQVVLFDTSDSYKQFKNE